MGCTCAFPTDKRSPESRMIEMRMAHERERYEKIVKLILLGIGDVGKTTFFRQFKLLFGEGIDDRTREKYREDIHIQCIAQMIRLANACIKYSTHEQLDAQAAYLKLSYESMEALNELKRYRDATRVTDEIARLISILWNDDAIKSGFEWGSKLAIASSSGYFWSQIDDVAKRGFMPSNHECVLLRTPTTGIDEVTFAHPNVPSAKFSVVDVGGQRCERRKWLEVFDNADAIIWVASLSAYDEVLYEDATVPAMNEQLTVYAETVNRKVFSETPIILFLNKSDLFQEKLRMRPLSKCFEEYAGSSDATECAQFVRQKFRERDLAEKRLFYSHVTCATNKDNVENVFRDVTVSIVFENTTATGIL